MRRAAGKANPPPPAQQILSVGTNAEGSLEAPLCHHELPKCLYSLHTLADCLEGQQFLQQMSGEEETFSADPGEPRPPSPLALEFSVVPTFAPPGHQFELF